MKSFVFALLLSCLAWPSVAAPPDSVVTGDLAASLRTLTPHDLDEVVWLARCIYSESDRSHEQRLVAWVVRNRVDTGYRGATYRDVVLERQQFSAFNLPSERRTHILSLGANSTLPAWRSALGIALDVYRADASERPFPTTVRHFYSPVSMEGGRTPDWARGVDAVDVAAFHIDPYRFRFFDAVDSSGAAMGPTDLSARTATARIGARTERIRTTRLGRLRLSGKVARPTRPTIERPSRSR